MALPDKFGRHTAAFAGDVLTIHYNGPIRLEDCMQLREIFSEMRREYGPCFVLVDMHNSNGIEPAARKYLADWSKDSPEQGLAGTAMYGISFAMRTILGLTLNAIKFLGKKMELENVVFLKDEAEARRWIDERRQLLAGGAHGGQ